MQKFSSPAIILLAAGMMLASNVQAQQTPASSTPSSSPDKTQSASAGKTAAGSGSASPLTTPKEKMSYAIGMNIGTTLHRESMDVDPVILERGIADALAGGKMLLTEDEARTALIQAQQQVRAAEEQRFHALAAANKAEGEAFLAANRNKEGVVTLPSGLQYRILQQGTGPKPTVSDIVSCNYRGTLLNGKEFDSSYKRGKPTSLPVGRVIKGWSEALQLMPVGSKWQLFVPPDLAYGDRGAGADIGPDATLIFEVELLSIEKPDQPKLEPGPNAPATPQQPTSTPSHPQ